MKMPTVNTLAFGNLKTRKKQYTLMIIGIILAMIFSSGSMFLVSSISNGLKDLENRQTGNQDLIFFGLTDDALRDGIDKLDITDYIDGEVLGFAYSEYEEAGTSVAKMSGDAHEMYYTRIIEGRYPENAGEIAFESDAMIRMKLKAKVGEKVTLNLKVQSGNEYLPETVEKTYTIVGIAGDRRTYISYRHGGNESFLPAAFVSEKENIEPGGKALRITFAKCSSSFIKLDDSYGQIYDFCTKHKELFPEIYNGFVETYMFHGAWAQDISGSGLTMIILSVVLMLISCVGIVNSFNTNLLERKKQIGFLRALGTTKRQIIKIFGREALILSLICTPVSLVISFFGAKLLVKLIGENMMFLPDFIILIVGAVFSVICVMLAALIPLFKASKISPMQAVRNIDLTRRMKNKNIESQKEFSMPELIAKRNMTFGKGKTVTVSIILVACILLSGFGFTALEYVKNDYYNIGGGDYHIMLDGGYAFPYTNYHENERSSGVSTNDVNDILCSPYVKSVVSRESRQAVIGVDRSSDYLRITDCGNFLPNLFVGGHMDYCDFTKENYTDIMEQLRLEELQNVRSGSPDAEYDDDYGKMTSKEDYKTAFAPDGEFAAARINAYDESFIEKLRSKVVAGKIDIDKINSGEEIILEANDKVGLVIYQEMMDIGILAESACAPLDKNGNPDSKRYVNGQKSRSTVVESANLDLRVGDEIEVSVLFNHSDDPEGLPNDKIYDADYVEKTSRKVKIGAIVENTNSRYSLGVITTNQGFRTFGKESRYTSVNVYLNTECTAEIDESMCEILEPIVSGTTGLYESDYQIRQSQQESYRILMIALLSVLLLMTTICTSLINNALTARIRESKKEIGTLRAVGASVSELTKSYILQLLSMFGIGLVSGFSIYALGVSGIKIYEKVKDTSLGLDFNLFIPLAVCAVIFTICSVNLFLKIREQTKASIVDNIREL